MRVASLRTMLELSERQRALLADKLPDLANLVAGGSVFSQGLSERPFSIVLAILGCGVWMWLMYLAVVLAEAKENDG